MNLLFKVIILSFTAVVINALVLGFRLAFVDKLASPIYFILSAGILTFFILILLFTDIWRYFNGRF